MKLWIPTHAKVATVTVLQRRSFSLGANFFFRLDAYLAVNNKLCQEKRNSMKSDSTNAKKINILLRFISLSI